MTEVMLNASMRSNLLSLQQTQKLQDRTQLRLSTGLKVNSAIDNPSSYYTATSLNNRASDLSALLDTMSQGIQTIKAANEALETGTAILQQAKAVAEKVSESSVDVVAKVHNEAELLAAVEKGGAGYIVVESNINLTNQLQLKDGQKLVGDNYFSGNDSPNRKLSFDFTGKAGDAVIAGNKSVVSNLDIDFISDSRINNYGVITARGAKNVTISNVNITFDTPNVLSGTHFGILANGGSDVDLTGQINIQGINSNSVGIGVYGETFINSYGVLNISTKYTGIKIGNGSTKEPNSTFNIQEGSVVNISSAKNYGIVVFAKSTLHAENAKINIISDGQGIVTSEQSTSILRNSQINIKATSYALNVNYSTIDIMGSVANLKSENLNAVNIFSNGGLPAALNISGDSEINLNSKSASTAIRLITGYTGSQTSLSIGKGVTININTGSASDASWKFTESYQRVDDRGNADSGVYVSHYISDFEGYADKGAAEAFPEGEISVPDIEESLKETFSGEASFTDKKADNKTYAETLSQYDMLVNDASYKGVNLLQSNDLKINFNEDRTSGVEVKGVDASSEGLGVRSFEWNTQMDILNSVEELENAINQLRSFSAEFGNYYAIVTTREDFTENLINVLTEGADKLILADMNAEAANMLALQTRQQLAINSLSLASQASQSVLKLF